MNCIFTISVDLDRDLVRIKLSGFFLPADIVRMRHEWEAAHEHLRCDFNQHLSVIDVTDLKIQSKEAVEQFRALLVDSPIRSRRAALIVPPTLTRSQIIRVYGDFDKRAGRRHVQFFDSANAAEAWLFDTPVVSASVGPPDCTGSPAPPLPPTQPTPPIQPVQSRVRARA